MAWWNPFRQKLNPAQQVISLSEGTSISSAEPVLRYTQYYEQLEIVNRAVNMIVDDVSEVRAKVGATTNSAFSYKGMKAASLKKLLNVEPNPFQDVNTFFRNLIIDYLIDGNIFIYFDGAHMYHLPAANVTINTDEKTYVKSYDYSGKITYSPSEVIHIKENSFDSIYRGTSRLKPCLRTMQLLMSMRKFQDNFFKNGAVPGLVLKTEATLSKKIKNDMILDWSQKYRPDAGGRRPLILDGGMSVEDISKINFRELDFESSITNCEETILKTLGVPPILLNSGNNANIRPNHRLYYLETIIPIVRKINFAFERFFGFKITEDAANIPALQPELQEQGSFLGSLVNNGIMKPNEAREILGLEPDSDPESSKLRIPANIAGSAANPSTGGRPPAGKD